MKTSIYAEEKQEINPYEYGYLYICLHVRVCTQTCS